MQQHKVDRVALSRASTYAKAAFSILTATFTLVSRYHQSISVLDFIGDKDDVGGGDNWSYETCKAPV